MDDVYSLRCFHNGIRRLTHTLSKSEAKAFLHTAKHLQAYLEREHVLPPGGMPKVDETWTKADVRKLYRLLVKRAKVMDRIQAVNVKIMLADLECACAIDDHLAGRT